MSVIKSANSILAEAIERLSNELDAAHLRIAALEAAMAEKERQNADLEATLQTQKDEMKLLEEKVEERKRKTSPDGTTEEGHDGDYWEKHDDENDDGQWRQIWARRTVPIQGSDDAGSQAAVEEDEFFTVEDEFEENEDFTQKGGEDTEEDANGREAEEQKEEATEWNRIVFNCES
uniref:Uncharacterized protein n=1 Tax=Steinernema glaseri TaxID=37863 RepID=A0A1I7Y8J5_9BILA